MEININEDLKIKISERTDVNNWINVQVYNNDSNKWELQYGTIKESRNNVLMFDKFVIKPAYLFHQNEDEVQKVSRRIHREGEVINKIKEGGCKIFNGIYIEDFAGKPYIISPRYEETCLDVVTRLNGKERVEFAHQAIHAYADVIECIAKQNLYYTDIKPENMFYDKGHFYLADLEVFNIRQMMDKQYILTPRYAGAYDQINFKSVGQDRRNIFKKYVEKLNEKATFIKNHTACIFPKVILSQILAYNFIWLLGIKNKTTDKSELYQSILKSYEAVYGTETLISQAIRNSIFEIEPFKKIRVGTESTGTGEVTMIPPPPPPGSPPGSPGSPVSPPGSPQSRKRPRRYKFRF